MKKPYVLTAVAVAGSGIYYGYHQQINEVVARYPEMSAGLGAVLGVLGVTYLLKSGDRKPTSLNMSELEKKIDG